MPPLFSILVPVYNHEEYIGAALDSLLAQTDPDWEALVVNDGSTDGTPAIIESYAKKDARIRVFHKSNGGQPTALNEGLEHACGQWICWLSSDDLFHPDKLAVHRDWIGRFPECRYFFTDFEMLEDETGAILPAYTQCVPQARWQVLDLFEANFINGISICVHRALFDEYGRFDASNRYGQDFDLHLRFLSHAVAIRIPDVTCVSRRHARQWATVENVATFADCAVAAIRLINAKPLADCLYPTPPLDRQSCLDVIDRAVEVAASPHAYLYQAGWHPALVMRLMEWIWTLGGDPAVRRRCIQCFGQKARALSVGSRSSPEAATWKVAAILAEYGPECSPFTPISIEEVFVEGVAHARLAGRDEWATGLEKHGVRLFGSAVASDAAGRGSAIKDSKELDVLVVESGNDEGKTVNERHRGGRVVISLRYGALPCWQWQKGVHTLHLPPGWRTWQAIASVPAPDVTMSGNRIPSWVMTGALCGLRWAGRVRRRFRRLAT